MGLLNKENSIKKNLKMIKNVAINMINDLFDEEYTMPYVRKGHTVYKKENNKLIKVGISKNPEKYLRVLRAVEHGWKPDKNNKTKRK